MRKLNHLAGTAVAVLATLAISSPALAAEADKSTGANQLQIRPILDARLRYEAFKAQAETCNGMTVQPATYGGALDLAYGMSQASDLLLRSDDVDVIYTPVIPLGMGAAQAVRQQGKDTKVVSSAIVREAIPMIKDGRLAAVASEPGILIGRLIVQYAIREHEGKELPHMVKDDALPYPNAIVPSPVITPENVDTYPFEVYDLPPQGWSITSAQ